MKQSSRLQSLRQEMAGCGLDVFLTSGRHNVFYLSGFSGSCGACIVDDNRAVLAVDFRYAEMAAEAVQGTDWQLVEVSGPFWSGLAAIVPGNRAISIEPGGLSMTDYLKLRDSLGGSKLEQAPPLTARLRSLKDNSEIEAIKAAQGLAEKSLQNTLTAMQTGSFSERDWATSLHCSILQTGADGAAFEPIVATVPNSARPHARPSDALVDRHKPLLIDWGARLGGYCSDCSRCHIGSAPESQRLRRAYDIVVQAIEAVLEAMRPGLSGAEIDAVARSIIEDAGYGDCFGHGLGHGVGLEVHEAPILGPGSQEILQPGMVVTIEPGIYIPGVGGVRVEELLVVGDERPLNLTGLSKNAIFM